MSIWCLWVVVVVLWLDQEVLTATIAATAEIWPTAQLPCRYPANNSSALDPHQNGARSGPMGASMTVAQLSFNVGNNAQWFVQPQVGTPAGGATAAGCVGAVNTNTGQSGVVLGARQYPWLVDLRWDDQNQRHGLLLHPPTQPHLCLSAAVAADAGGTAEYSCRAVIITDCPSNGDSDANWDRAWWMLADSPAVSVSPGPTLTFLKQFYGTTQPPLWQYATNATDTLLGPTNPTGLFTLQPVDLVTGTLLSATTASQGAPQELGVVLTPWLGSNSSSSEQQPQFTLQWTNAATDWWYVTELCSVAAEEEWFAQQQAAFQGAASNVSPHPVPTTTDVPSVVDVPGVTDANGLSLQTVAIIACWLILTEVMIVGVILVTCRCARVMQLQWCCVRPKKHHHHRDGAAKVDVTMEARKNASGQPRPSLNAPASSSSLSHSEDTDTVALIPVSDVGPASVSQSCPPIPTLSPDHGDCKDHPVLLPSLSARGRKRLTVATRGAVRSSFSGSAWISGLATVLGFGGFQQQNRAGSTASTEQTYRSLDRDLNESNTLNPTGVDSPSDTESLSPRLNDQEVEVVPPVHEGMRKQSDQRDLIELSVLGLTQLGIGEVTTAGTEDDANDIRVTVVPVDRL